MRRLICVLLVVALAGCVGPASGPADSPTSTATPSETPAGDAVAYADLSPDEQAAFDAALDGEARFLPDSDYVDGEFHDPASRSVFYDHEYVTKDGTTYALDFHQGDLYASYEIHANPASLDENATVVPYENLSEDVATEVRWAIENGSHGVPLGKWQSLPGELRDLQYVSYEGETYRLSYAVGDYWVEVMTAEET